MGKLNPLAMPKKKSTGKKASVEDIYKNKHFVPPKEQNLETIFEEPRQSKDGAQILTSVKKYKRYLHFDPSMNKIQKRKRKARKCFKKLKVNYFTRSSPENSSTNDISNYILDALGDDSDSDNMDESDNTKISLNTDQSEASLVNFDKDVACADLLDTPKRNCKKRKSFQLKSQDVVSISDTNEHCDSNETIASISKKHDIDSEKTSILNNDEEKSESPRRSCCIS